MSGRPLPGEESRPAPPDDLGAARGAVPQARPGTPGTPGMPAPASAPPASREPPPPLEANDQLVTAVFTAGWAVAVVVLLIVHADLPPAQRWWIWTALAGFGMGLFGLAYVPFLKRSRARAAQRRSHHDPGHS